jgi:WD40 repeat protein
MYARVAATRVFPGARWTIVRGNISGQTALLARQTALSVVPLGWSDKAPLYLAATATDTSLYSAQNGHSTFRTILIPQVVTGASLSPDGHTIAFAVPTGCGYCTVDLFDLRTLTTVYGPSGWGSQWNYAWTADGRQLVTSGPKGLAVIDVSDGSRYDVTRPKGLGRVWPHAMRATVAHGVRLTDTVTGATYTSAS